MALEAPGIVVDLVYVDEHFLGAAAPAFGDSSGEQAAADPAAAEGGATYSSSSCASGPSQYGVGRKVK